MGGESLVPDRRPWALALALALALGLGCLRPPAPPVFAVTSREEVPPVSPREFRAVWVATVANIDWPSRRDLPVEDQQREALAIIQKAKALHLNAIIFQVRTAADALYASELEPWSEYLTGAQGRAPEPYYDPLAFWVAETHKAGLELHAWFNPYRAKHPSAKSPLAPNHLALTRPEAVKTYGDYLWMDPAEPGAVAQSLAVMVDVARRYDIDGVHIDDYFYPYPIKDAAGAKVPFPDDPSWQAYLARGGTLSREDWRRVQVDQFVKRLYEEVHAVKPHLRVGVSPFGLGRPGRRPLGVKGFSQYDELYANVELWLEQGWMDYLVPQLYWRTDAPEQPFLPLLDTWRAGNPKGRPVWPGLFTSQLGAAKPWPEDEISRQIEATRSRPGDTGHAHFSMVALTRDYAGISGRLAGLYPGPALLPAAPWLGVAAPPAPSLRLGPAPGDPGAIRVEPTGEAPWRLAVWARYGEAWHFSVLSGTGGTLPAALDGRPLRAVTASAVGRTGLESPRVVLPFGGG